MNMSMDLVDTFNAVRYWPVVQNFVSLTLSLSPQFGNFISTSIANKLLFFAGKM